MTSVAKRCRQILADRTSDGTDLGLALRDAITEIDRLEGLIEHQLAHDEMYGRRSGARAEVLFT